MRVVAPPFIKQVLGHRSNLSAWARNTTRSSPSILTVLINDSGNGRCVVAHRRVQSKVINEGEEHLRAQKKRSLWTTFDRACQLRSWSSQIHEASSDQLLGVLACRRCEEQSSVERNERTESIIDSMTGEERTAHESDANRRRGIARGSGTNVAEGISEQALH